MTSSYATYTNYTTDYGGTAIASAAWTNLAVRASAAIDRLTLDRAAAIVTAATETDTIEKIMLATCALAETLQTQASEPDGVIASETVGRHSVSYVQGSMRSKESAQSDAVSIYLAGTGLMFRGFNSGEYSGTVDDEDE